MYDTWNELLMSCYNPMTSMCLRASGKVANMQHGS